MNREKKQTNRAIASDKESIESRKLFLKAVLAEYAKLNEDMNQHGRNIIYIFSVMIGGFTTLIGVFGVIGSLSLLLTPIFLSFCLLGVFAEHYTTVLPQNTLKKKLRIENCMSCFRMIRQFNGKEDTNLNINRIILHLY